jgi:hypothetical protein
MWSLSSGPAWGSARIQDSLRERPLWAIMAPSLVVAPGRPFVHLLFHLADLGGKSLITGLISSPDPHRVVRVNLLREEPEDPSHTA